MGQVFSKGSLFALLLATPACGALFGADFDVPKASVGATGTDAGEARVDSPLPVGADGSCAVDRKLCGTFCVSLRDPAYGCAAEACEPCSLESGTATCTEGACSVGSCADK